MAQRKEIRIDQLPPQQLSSLKAQLEEELQGLQQSALTLQNVAAEFHHSGEAIERLSDQRVGQPMLLPLSQSLYVQGELADAEHVLLDIGTGYYLEKPLEGGVDYCRRKVVQMADNLKEIQKVQQQKLQALQTVDSVLQQKMREAAAAQQAGPRKDGPAAVGAA